jgi:phosphate transport system substrate-binding protein
MMDIVTRVASDVNYQNSLGYSFLYYVKEMVKEHNIRFLAIDGAEANHDTIANGTYPFAYDFYAVTAKREGEYLNPERAENIDAFLDWMLSPQGQYLVEATGYTSIGASY